MTIWGVSESYLRWFSLSFSVLFILGVVGLALYERIYQQAGPVEIAVSLAKNSGPMGMSIAIALIVIITIWEEITVFFGKRVENMREGFREEGRAEGREEGVAAGVAQGRTEGRAEAEAEFKAWLERVSEQRGIDLDELLPK